VIVRPNTWHMCSVHSMLSWLYVIYCHSNRNIQSLNVLFCCMWYMR